MPPPFIWGVGVAWQKHTFVVQGKHKENVTECWEHNLNTFEQTMTYEQGTTKTRFDRSLCSPKQGIQTFWENIEAHQTCNLHRVSIPPVDSAGKERKLRSVHAYWYFLKWLCMGESRVVFVTDLYEMLTVNPVVGIFYSKKYLKSINFCSYGENRSLASFNISVGGNSVDIYRKQSELPSTESFPVYLYLSLWWNAICNSRIPGLVE